MWFGGISLLTGLVIAWAFFTSILILLLVYRGMVGMHQDDTLVLSAASRAIDSDNAEAEARIVKLRPYLWASTVLSAVMAVAAIALWASQAASRF